MATTIPNLPTASTARTGASHPYVLVQGGRKADKPALTADPLANRILAGLPPADLDRLTPHLECVHLESGAVIDEYGTRGDYVHFPVSAIVSLRYDMEDGASAEVALVGREGMVGVGLFMAGETLPGLAIVQGGGHAFRLSTRVLRREFERSEALQHALLCYTQALIVEIAQNAVCNRHHSIQKQLCRCLLLTLDRSSSDEMALTHETIANSLGVRRECVTVAAGKLRKLGLIEYRRGRIRVVDRDGLEAQSCECRGVVRRAFDRLLPVPGANDDAAGRCGTHERAGLSHRAQAGSRSAWLRALK